MSRLTPRAFLQQLEDAAAAFRAVIELEVENFPADEAASKKRVQAVNDPETGYQFFAETYFPHYLGKPSSKLHALLFRDLPAMVNQESGQKRLIIAPRGSAKSTHISLIFPLWCVMRGLKHYIALIMDAFEQSAVMLEALKAELEVNPRLANDFPETVGIGRLWREGALITRNHIKLEAFGTGKKIRGRRHGPYRPDLAILDDIENDENVKNPKLRDKLQDWIAKAVLELGPTDGSMDVLYCGTVLHFDAVICRFAKKPGWKTSRFSAVLKWPDAMDLWDQWEELYINDEGEAAEAFYGKHKKAMNQGAELNWPQNHSLLYLMEKRAGGHAAFESEYQNKPISEDNHFQKIIYWARPKPNLLTFGAIDPSLGKNNHARDPSAILVGAIDKETGVMDVLEASIRRRTPDLIIDKAIEYQQQYHCQIWFVETVQFQEMLRTELIKRAAARRIAMPAYPVTPITDKQLRIERLVMPIMDGQIRLHNSQAALIDQLQQWPSADHDDGPDCLEMLWTHAMRFSRTALTPQSLTVSAPEPLATEGY